MSDRTNRPVEPLPSATVVLVREAPRRPEVLMVRRHARAAFGASYVFPGGVLDRSDRAAHAHCRRLSADEADDILGLDCGGLDYYSAAIREAFEETGVLLARDAKGNWAFADGSMDEAEIDEIRRRLVENQDPWPEFLARHDLRLDCGSLHYCAFWVTPKSEPRRFSTRFFVAALPEGQNARHDEKELTDSRWMRASEALQAASAGEIDLIRPTRSMLEDIEACESVRQIIDWARQRAEDGIAAVRPAIIDVDGRARIVMPGDPLYPEQGGQ